VTQAQRETLEKQSRWLRGSLRSLDHTWADAIDALLRDHARLQEEREKGVKFDWSVLGQLRHAFKLGVRGEIGDHEAFVRGLIAPAIRELERLQEPAALVTEEGP
jgi:hypothetical protein